MTRSIPELTRLSAYDRSRTPQERDKEATFYVRLGRLSEDMERLEPTATWSRASRVARTWRSHLAWRLWLALGKAVRA